MHFLNSSLPYNNSSTNNDTTTFSSQFLGNSTNSTNLSPNAISTNLLDSVLETLLGSSALQQNTTTIVSTSTAIPPVYQIFPNASEFVPYDSSLVEPMSNSLSNIFMISAAVPILSVTLLGNLLVLLVWLTHRPFRTPSNLYLISLAFADSLTALVVIFAVHSTVVHKWTFGLLSCKIWIVTWHMINTTAAFHLVAIAVDRYRTLTEGVSYLQRKSFKSVAEKIICIWILSAWVMTPLIFDWEHLSLDPSAQESCGAKKIPHWVAHFSSASFWFPGAFLIITYYKVHNEIKRRVTVLKQRGRNLYEPSSEAKLNDKDWNTEVPACLTAISEDTIQDVESKGRNKADPLKARERRSLMTMTIISGGFILCWLPWNLVSLYDAFLNFPFKINSWVYTATLVIGQVNCFINPIIYAARIPEFRAALNILYSKCKCTT